jgi:hypothetical protein
MRHHLWVSRLRNVASVCVTAPKIVGVVRFFVRNAGVSTGQLRVEVIVKGKTYPAGTISADTAWAPTPVLAPTAPQYKGAVTYQVRASPQSDRARRSQSTMSISTRSEPAEALPA